MGSLWQDYLRETCGIGSMCSSTGLNSPPDASMLVIASMMQEYGRIDSSSGLKCGTDGHLRAASFDNEEASAEA